jgi:hypothetical protein
MAMVRSLVVVPGPMTVMPVLAVVRELSDGGRGGCSVRRAAFDGAVGACAGAREDWQQ